IDATSLRLDNAPGQPGAGPLPGATIQGSLEVKAGTIFTGANTLNIDQYANVSLTATNGVFLQNTGGISSQTNLTITTPVIIGSAQANQTISAQGGALTILAPPAGAPSSSLSFEE